VEGNFRTRHATIIGVIRGRMECVRRNGIAQVGSIVVRRNQILFEGGRRKNTKHRNRISIVVIVCTNSFFVSRRDCLITQ